MKYLIGIDIGTSSTKTVLFDQNLNIKASSSMDYPIYQPNNGWAEQKPEDWKNAVLKTIRAVIDKSGVSGEDVISVGLSGQMHGLVMLDENNKVIRDAIIWCDQRTSEQCDEITEKIGAERLVEITANPALTGFTASKILWVKNNEEHNYKKCRHILLPKDYIRFILTGEYATDVSDASGMQLMDIKNRCWSDEVLLKLGIDKDMLGRLYESSEITGKITPEAARLTGLGENTVVVGGAGDNAAAAVGTGIVKDGRAFVTIGTSGVVYAHTSKPVIDKKGRVHTFCCAVKGCWHIMGVTQAAGLSLKWFKDNFCADLDLNKDKDIYDTINILAEKSGIGANKLIYLPYLMGERTPHLDADCRGTFFGLSAMHKRADLLRAIFEGVAFSLKDCKDILDEMNILSRTFTVCGGGGKSPVWRQILSDAFNTEVKTISTDEGPALGAAILAGVGAGVFESVEQACENYIKTDIIIKPNKINYEKYLKLHKIYKNLYNSLKDDYKALAQLEI